MFNTDGLTEQEKNIRRDLIAKIRNYVDCFTEYEVIDEVCGDITSFKQSLYSKYTQSLNAIYEEIQIGLNIYIITRDLFSAALVLSNSTQNSSLDGLLIDIRSRDTA